MAKTIKTAATSLTTLAAQAMVAHSASAVEPADSQAETRQPVDDDFTKLKRLVEAAVAESGRTDLMVSDERGEGGSVNVLVAGPDGVVDEGSNVINLFAANGGSEWTAEGLASHLGKLADDIGLRTYTIAADALGTVTALPTVIVPTVGQRLHFYPNAEHQAELGVFDPSQPCDAGVLYVHNERRVNLLVTGPSGTQRALQNVQLAQADDVVADGDSYAVWMLYQYAQAAKHGA